MKILNLGSLNIDYVYSTDHIVRPGETLQSEKMEIFPGGKGLNQSVAIARAGKKVYHAGLIGQSDGTFLKELLCSEGVDTGFIKELSEEKTGHAIIQIDKDGQNSIILFGGANQKIDRNYIDEVLSHFDKGDWILIQNEVSELEYILERAKKTGMFIILNPSPVNKAIIRAAQSADLLIMNEIEAGAVLGIEVPEYDMDIESRDLPERLRDKEIFITFGDKGSVYIGKHGNVRQKAYTVKVIDTTAAGDTYTGYLIASLSDGNDVKSAMRTASRAASVACTVKGASVSIPHIDEI